MEMMKDILERVEKKMIMGGKIYSAMSFQFWVVVLAGYYVISYAIKDYGITTMVYWTSAGIFFIYLMRKIWKKIVQLYEAKRSYRGIEVVTWLIAAFVGWFLIPWILQTKIGFLVSLAIGLLSFIFLGIIGMLLTYHLITKRWEKELLPGAFIPLILMPLLFFISIDLMYYAGMIVVLAYGITVFLYLYDAFKYIG